MSCLCFLVFVVGVFWVFLCLFGVFCWCLCKDWCVSILGGCIDLSTHLDPQDLKFPTSRTVIQQTPQAR